MLMQTNLNRLLQVENFPFGLIAHHASIHLRIHHLNRRHTLKQPKATKTHTRLMAFCPGLPG